MTSANKTSAQDTIDPRLAEKIKSLPETSQLILLKQLLKGDITAAIYGLVNKMSEDQQLTLLEQLQEHPVKPADPKETEIALRGQSRKSCMLSTDYFVEDQNFEGFILDISTAGAFIETAEAFTAGQQIQLAFSLPNVSNKLTITGEILWKGTLGIGVQFKTLSRDLTNKIKAFVEKEQKMQ